MAALDKIRVADMTGGKAKDNGYRGVHVYFQMSSFHYPIEIQYNTFHKYVYKRKYENHIGSMLR